MVAAPGAAGVAEHQDALLVVLERLRLGEVGRPGPALDGEAPVAGAIHLGDDAPRPSGDLGHLLRCRSAARSGRARPAPGRATPGARSGGRAAPRPRGTARAGRRGAPGARPGCRRCRCTPRTAASGTSARDSVRTCSRGVASTDEIAPLLGGDVGEPPLHQRLAGRDELHDGGVPGLQVALDALDQRRRLHRRDAGG